MMMIDRQTDTMIVVFEELTCVILKLWEDQLGTQV